MKLFVILYGLFTVGVPSAPDTPVEVLFLDSSAHEVQGHHGAAASRLPRHELSLTYYQPAVIPGGTAIETRVRWKGPMALGLGGAEAVQLGDGLLDLSAIVTAAVGEGRKLTLRPECSGDDALSTCVGAKGEPLLVGRLELGGGRLAVGEVDPRTRAFQREPEEADAVTATFLPLAGSAPPNEAEAPTFNALLFQADLPAGTNATTLRVGSETLTLVVQKLQQCPQLAGDASVTECVVLEVANVADAALAVAVQDFVEGLNQTHGLGFPLPDMRVDTHFAAVYSLLSGVSAEEQLVPHFRPAPGEDPPYGRCIPPRVYQPAGGAK